MASPLTKCAFCDAEAVTKGGEHIWDDWINKQLPKKTRFHAKKRLSLVSTPIQFDSSGLNEKLPAVCAECNSGWMSAITAKVKERFSATILKGKPISLGPRDAALLAAFTLMKAIVQDYRNESDPFFTIAARQRLRTSLAIPPLVKMWFAAHQGAARFTFHSHLRIVSPNEPGPLEGMQFLSYTYIVGNLALQLLAPRWKDVLDRGRPLVTLNPNAYWQTSTTQFWPDAGKVLSWPPEKYIGDSVIEQFLNRFHVPIQIPIR